MEELVTLLCIAHFGGPRLPQCAVHADHSLWDHVHVHSNAPTPPQSTRALGTVHWAYNHVVDVGISNGRMVVTVNGRLQRPGPVLAVAAAGTSGQEKCNYHPDRCYNGWCDSRRVDILHPAITIAITQPYMRSGRSGRFANWLEV